MRTVVTPTHRDRPPGKLAQDRNQCCVEDRVSESQRRVDKARQLKALMRRRAGRGQCAVEGVPQVNAVQLLC